ncbi:MAG: PEP-CTERM sorting domain-containing protein [Bryobacteraceae bacterium]|nr:PEP-CTERM sorting domain-containing protein [Bryobacteraceae bacterium]
MKKLSLALLLVLPAFGGPVEGISEGFISLFPNGAVAYQTWQDPYLIGGTSEGKRFESIRWNSPTIPWTCDGPACTLTSVANPNLQLFYLDGFLRYDIHALLTMDLLFDDEIPTAPGDVGFDYEYMLRAAIGHLNGSEYFTSSGIGQGIARFMFSESGVPTGINLFFGLQPFDVNLRPAAVPEPSTLVLGGIGAGTVWLARRRRKGVVCAQS